MLYPPLSLSLCSADDTARIARSLAPRLRPGDVVLMTGDIGAGKTHFARSLIQSLMDPVEDVPSPTFTLVQTYDTRLGELWHSDLYRLSHPDEVIELGLLDAFEDAICLVEWPDRLGELEPPGALSLSLALGKNEGERTLTFDWTAPDWATKLKDLC